MIAGIIGCRNEAWIIDAVLRHHLAEGLDRIYVNVGSSNDDTAEIVEALAGETGQLVVQHDYDPIYCQANVMNALAARAGEDGAVWIAPFDADEFLYVVDGRTIADALTACAADKLYVQAFVHHDWSARVVAPKFWNKVAYRWQSGAILTMGQHNVSILGGEPGVLALREWQYRDFDHFIAKRDLWISALSDDDRARGDSAHYERLRDFDREDLRREWDAMRAVETIADPVPSRINPGFRPHGRVQ